MKTTSCYPDYLPQSVAFGSSEYETVEHATGWLNDMIMDDPDPYTNKQTVKQKMFKLSDVQMITLRKLYVDKDFACSEITDGVFTIHMKKRIYILKIGGNEAYFESKYDAMMWLDKYKTEMKKRAITVLRDDPISFVFTFGSDETYVSVAIRSPILNKIPGSWLWSKG